MDVPQAHHGDEHGDHDDACAPGDVEGALAADVIGHPAHDDIRRRRGEGRDEVGIRQFRGREAGILQQELGPDAAGDVREEEDAGHQCPRGEEDAAGVALQQFQQRGTVRLPGRRGSLPRLRVFHLAAQEPRHQNGEDEPDDERHPPSPLLVRRAHAVVGGDEENEVHHQGDEERSDAGGTLNARGDETPAVRRCVLHRQRCRGGVLAAEEDSFDETEEEQQGDRHSRADRAGTGQARDEQRHRSEAEDGDRPGVPAAEPVGEVPEDQAAQWPPHQGRRERQAREDRLAAGGHVLALEIGERG